MPSPKVFISSTCYDLGMAREQLRSFLTKLGYDPVLSEYSDVLYDPRVHTHTSCIQEVPNADMIVVLIGSRFGGRAIPEALSQIDLDKLVNSSFNVSVLDTPENLSITQLEVLKAIDASVPVFAFVEEKVMHDHFVYQKNKDIAEKIDFPSISKPESARYIFEFINFLSHRNVGNSVIPFSRIEDIESHLKKQWGALFQKLLREQRESSFESRKIFAISEQIEGLKTAVISTIESAQSREVARGVIKFRRLADFLHALRLPDFSVVTNSTYELDEILDMAGIKEVRSFPSRSSSDSCALIKEDGTFYELRFGEEFLNKISVDWQSFVALTEEVRRIIFETLSDMERMGPNVLRYRDISFDEYFDEFIQKDRVETAMTIGDIIKQHMRKEELKS